MLSDQPWLGATRWTRRPSDAVGHRPRRWLSWSSSSSFVAWPAWSCTRTLWPSRRWRPLAAVNRTALLGQNGFDGFGRRSTWASAPCRRRSAPPPTAAAVTGDGLSGAGHLSVDDNAVGVAAASCRRPRPHRPKCTTASSGARCHARRWPSAHLAASLHPCLGGGETQSKVFRFGTETGNWVPVGALGGRLSLQCTSSATGWRLWSCFPRSVNPDQAEYVWHLVRDRFGNQAQQGLQRPGAGRLHHLRQRRARSARTRGLQGVAPTEPAVAEGPTRSPVARCGWRGRRT